MNTRAKLIKRIAYGYRSFEYFALKLKAAFPGRGRNPLMLLGEWTAVIKSRLCHTDLGMERESPLFFNHPKSRTGWLYNQPVPYFLRLAAR